MGLQTSQKKNVQLNSAASNSSTAQSSDSTTKLAELEKQTSNIAESIARIEQAREKFRTNVAAAEAAVPTYNERRQQYNKNIHDDRQSTLDRLHAQQMKQIENISGSNASVRQYDDQNLASMGYQPGTGLSPEAVARAVHDRNHSTFNPAFGSRWTNPNSPLAQRARSIEDNQAAVARGEKIEIPGGYGEYSTYVTVRSPSERRDYQLQNVAQTNEKLESARANGTDLSTLSGKFYYQKRDGSVVGAGSIDGYYRAIHRDTGDVAAKEMAQELAEARRTRYDESKMHSEQRAVAAFAKKYGLDSDKLTTESYKTLKGDIALLRKCEDIAECLADGRTPSKRMRLSCEEKDAVRDIWQRYNIAGSNTDTAWVNGASHAVLARYKAQPVEAALTQNSPPAKSQPLREKEPNQVVSPSIASNNAPAQHRSSPASHTAQPINPAVTPEAVATAGVVVASALYHQFKQLTLPNSSQVQLQPSTVTMPTDRAEFFTRFSELHKGGALDSASIRVAQSREELQEMKGIVTAQLKSNQTLSPQDRKLYEAFNSFVDKKIA